MLSESNLYTRSVLSNSVKREVLWNVVEPGDPYDIKRSMIARLPGDRRLFMGDHLDLVCLFQAAEIERLCEFLEDYKLKFRDIERSNLDRHSYEIQIKELTQEMESFQSLKAENGKLKEFVKKQGVEIQNLQRTSREGGNINDTFKIMYEKSGEKLAQLSLENQKLFELNEEYRVQVQNFNARLQAFERAKNKEIEDLKLNSAEYSKESFQNTLNIHKFQSQGEIRRLQFELKRLKDAYDQKVHEVAILAKTNQDYSRELALTKGKGESRIILEHKAYEFETKLNYAATENQRLTISLREANSRYEESQLRRREIQRKIEKYDFQIREYEGKLRMSNNENVHLNQVIKKIENETKKIGDSKSFIIQYESRIMELNRANELMNSKILMQVNNSQRLREDSEKLMFENSKYKLIERENSQIRQGLAERDNLKRRTIQLESRIAVISQELERNYLLNKNKDAQIQKFRNIAFEYENSKAKVKEVEYVLTNKYESELTRTRTEYEQKIEYITRAKGNEFQLKAQTYERQSERLKELLKSKTEESQKQRSRIYELENHINRFQLETTTKLKNYENNFTSFKKENEQLYLRTRKLEEVERKLYEFQNKSAQLEKEYERLSNLIKSREEELFGLKNRLRDTQGYNQKYELDISRKITGYEQNINTIRVENEELRKKINEFVNESNKKLNDSVQEINRLNTAQRTSNEEKSQLDFKLKQVLQQNENLKQNLQKMYKDSEELRVKLMESQVKYSNFFNQSSFNTKRLTTQNETFKKQLNDYKISIANYESEVNRRFATNEQSISSLSKENQEVKRRIRELEVESSNLKQQLDVTVKKLRAKHEQFAFLENNHKNLVVEYENARKYHQEYEISVKSRFEGEVGTKYANYEQTIQSLRNENETLRRKVADLDQRLAQYSQQFEKINLALRNSTQQNDNLKKQIAVKQNNTVNFEVDVKNRIANYQSNIQNLIRVNEELQGNLANTANNLNKKNEDVRQLDEKYRQLSSQFDTLQRNFSNLELTFKNKMQGEVTKRYNNYEEVINKMKEERNELVRQLELLSKQQEKVTINFNQAGIENEALRKRVENYETSIAAYEMEVNKRFAVYEQNIAGLVKERQELVKRLQQDSGDANRKLIQAQTKLRNTSHQLERLSLNFKEVNERQNEELRRKSQELNELQRRSIQLQSRLSFANQDIERLNTTLKVKQEEMNKLQLRSKNQAQEIEAFRRQCSDLQAKFAQTYEVQVVKKYNNYQNFISQLKKQINESENVSTGRLQEIERLSNILKSKSEQSTQFTSNYRSITNDFEQFKKRVRENESIFNQNLTLSKRQNQDLRRKLMQSELFAKQLKDESERRLAEFQNKTRIMNQQIERLNQILKGKMNELESSRKNLKEYELSFNQTKDIESKNKSVQQNMFGQLSRKLAEAENRVMILSQENERLNNILKVKAEDNARLEAANRNLSTELDLTKKTHQELNEVTRKIPEYEQRMGFIIQQNQKLQFSLRSKTDALSNLEFKLKELSQQNEQLRRQVNQTELNWAKRYELDISRKATSFQQNLSLVSKQRDELAKRKAEYESKIAILTQQIERLNQSNKGKTEQLSRAVAEIENMKQFSQKKIQISESESNNWQSNYKIISNEYENAKKHLQQYELNIKKLYLEFQRLQNIINDLKKQRQVLFDKNHALSEEINRLRIENQDLEAQTKDVRLRLSDQSSLQKRINEHMALMVILFAEIESLRKRVSDKQRQVEDVRRRSISPNIV